MGARLAVLFPGPVCGGFEGCDTALRNGQVKPLIFLSLFHERATMKYKIEAQVFGTTVKTAEFEAEPEQVEQMVSIWNMATPFIGLTVRFIEAPSSLVCGHFHNTQQ